MSVTIEPARRDRLCDDLLAAWAEVPVSVAVDQAHVSQVNPAIRRLGLADGMLCGRALTVRCAPPDFGAVVHALDHVRPGDVLVIDAGGDLGTAMIGGILGEHVRRLGCAGVVVDGVVRDIAELGGWRDFPVYARGVNPRGPIAKSEGALNVPVTLGGRVVEPGDLVLGDLDGLAVLTPVLAQDRLADAQAKLALERRWIEGLTSGKSAAEVFGL